MTGGTSLFAAVLCGAWLAGSLTGSAAAQTDESRSQERATEAARAGMFLPLTEAPRTDSARAFIVALGGYDGASNSEVLEGRGEVTIYGPIALRIGVLHTQQRELRPTLGASIVELGLDSRVRFDLGTEEDKLEEEGGAEYDLLAGPLASVSLGAMALGAQAGVAVRGTQSTQVGMLALATISGAMSRGSRIMEGRCA